MNWLPVLLVSTLFVVLGIRLVRIGSQSGGSERWLALFFLLVGVALPIRTAVVGGDITSNPTLPLWNAASHLVMSLSLCAFTLFIWRVFRAQEPWARVFAGLLVVGHLASAPALVLLGGHREEAHVSVLCVNAFRTVVFLWAFVEALVYHRRMAKRLALHLADPLVVNRFRLFAIWTGALFVLPATVMLTRIVLLASGQPAEDPARIETVMTFVRVMILITGVVSFSALWLSFFPPRFYIRKIESA